MIQKFLDSFSNNPTFSLPLTFQWTVTIDDRGLKREIKKVLKDLDNTTDWSVYDTNEWMGYGEHSNILVAQEVSLPSESYQTISLGQPNRGGFMPGYGITERSDFLSRNISINFIETGVDIEAHLFRPWIIALGTTGLLNTKLRADINITEYNKDMSVRKEYKFFKAFPTNSEGYSLNYTSGEFIVKSVTFGFTDYTILKEVPKTTTTTPPPV